MTLSFRAAFLLRRVAWGFLRARWAAPRLADRQQDTTELRRRQLGDLGVLQGVSRSGVAEEARTRGFATPALAGCAFVAVDYAKETNRECQATRPGDTKLTRRCRSAARFAWWRVRRRREWEVAAHGPSDPEPVFLLRRTVMRRTGVRSSDVTHPDERRFQ
jgi:hypothetical protein